MGKSLFLLAAITLLTIPLSAHAERPLQYNRDIRPILSDNCFHCHGFDPATREMGLRLDVREAAVEERRGGAAIVPGDAAASQIIQRMRHHDPSYLMPPPESTRELSEEQIATIERWINEGAEYEEHWAYLPPERPAVPSPRDGGWIRNPVDAFVLQRLEEEDLAPSPEADRAALLRRLSLDLVGLPPTPEELHAYLADDGPEAYERAVDRLLDSPHYGERMALDWLDQVRYADTNGYHGDQYREIWAYRDYVIQSFNKNKPFDQFTIEQFAGDLLPEPTLEQKIASGYNRLNQLTAEGGAQPGEYRAIYMADRVRTAGSAWLGKTLACAECHDHKYDPVTIDDFYRFGAFFADIQEEAVYDARSRWEPILHLPAPELEREIALLEARKAELEDSLEKDDPERAREQRQWERTERARLVKAVDPWVTPTPLTATSNSETMFTPLEDGSLLTRGPVPDHEVFDITLPVPADEAVTAVRLQALVHDTLPGKGLGRGSTNFVLTGIEIEADGQPLAIARAEADVEQPGFPVAHALDLSPANGWAPNGHNRPGEDTEALFVLAEAIPAGAHEAIVVRLRFESPHTHHSIGRPRLSLTDDAHPALDANARIPERVRVALLQEPRDRTEAQQALLDEHYRGIAPELAAIRTEITQAEARIKQARNEIPTMMITVALDEPRETRVLPRGDWMDESGPVVEPAIPAIFGSLDTNGSRATRLDLARWLVSRDNPLTARVFVNRQWRHFFGTGLARDVDDFGLQGEWPSHPELLDWLAVEFMDSGWDMKHIARLIVTSSAYRQSSFADDAMRNRDPNNRLIARQSRYRIKAELVRDNALAISGLLTPTIGGPSVYPYQPEGYWANANTFVGPLIYETSEGEDQYRRGLYTIWKRSFLHPSLMAFDAPAREECTPHRPTSNTPLQALVLLNDPSFVEAARVLAERLVRHGGASFEERIEYAFQRAVARAPELREVERLRRLYRDQLAAYSDDPKAARALVSVGQAPVPDDLNPAELAAWTAIARVILNLHEVITRA